ncbi:MAG: hypothetical protein AAFV95_24580 [Bacteroidota bacterium]
MKNSPLFQVFARLDKKEKRELKKWVRSPAFNQRQDVVQLYEHLLKISSPDDKRLRKEYIFQKLYPGLPFEDEKIRVCQFYLFKLLKSYLVFQEAQRDESRRQIHLCEAYNRKGLGELYEKEWHKTLHRLQQQPQRHAEYHHQHFQLRKEYIGRTLREKRSDDIDIDTAMQALKSYYLSETLRLSCSMRSQQHLTRKEYDLQGIQEVLEMIEQGDHLSHPSIAIYYHGYQLLSETENSDHFATFRQTLAAHWQQFPPGECRGLYLLAINYCIRQLNRGQRQFIRQAFQLYRNALQNKVLLEDGFISKFAYNNILTLAIALSEWVWAADFLEQYKAYLPPDERQNIYEYNLAIYYFRKPDYEKAQQLLRRVEFKDRLYNLNGRSMLARIYFELDEFDALASLLDSFHVYLRRQEQLSYHRDNYLNFILFLRKMLRSNLSDSSTRQELQRELGDISAIAEKKWLLEQLK